jgi:hypothetical protein
LSQRWDFGHRPLLNTVVETMIHLADTPPKDPPYELQTPLTQIEKAARLAETPLINGHHRARWSARLLLDENAA